jgi:hypothetical protein
MPKSLKSMPEVPGPAALTLALDHVESVHGTLQLIQDIISSW